MHNIHSESDKVSVSLLPVWLWLWFCLLFSILQICEKNRLLCQVSSTLLRRTNRWEERQKDEVECHTNIRIIMLWELYHYSHSESFEGNWRAKQFGNKREYQKRKDIIILRIANEREELEWRLQHFIVAVRCQECFWKDICTVSFKPRSSNQSQPITTIRNTKIWLYDTGSSDIDMTHAYLKHRVKRRDDISKYIKSIFFFGLSKDWLNSEQCH